MALIRIQLRRGTAAEWAQANPVLAIGEPGLETDTKLQKVGDGTTAWLGLPYSTVVPEAVQQALAAVGQAGAAADAADAAATLASDKAAAAGASAAAAAAVPTTTDGLVRQLLETPGSQTVEKLTATYALKGEGGAQLEIQDAIGEYAWLSPTAMYRTVPSPRTYFGAISATGAVLACYFDHGTGRQRRVEIGQSIVDDHCVPSASVPEGGVQLWAWTDHSQDNLVRFRVGDATGDLDTLGPLRTYNAGGLASYTHIIRNPANLNEVWMLNRTWPSGLTYRWTIVKGTIDPVAKNITWGTRRDLIVFASGDQGYITLAPALIGSNYGVRFAVVGNPTNGTLHDVFYGNIDLVTGDVASPDKTLTANVSTGTGLPLAPADLNVAWDAPEGTTTRLSAVRDGGDPAVFIATWNEGVSDPDVTYKHLTRSAGTSVATPGLSLPTSGSYASSPDAAVFETPSLKARILAKPTTWAVSQTFARKFNSTGEQRTWTFGTISTGALRIQTFPTGTSTAITTDSTATVDPTAVGVGFDFTPSNGSNRVTRFWQTLDGTTWTQIGTDITGATTTLFNGTGPVELGRFAGVLQKVELYAAWDSSTLVASPDFRTTPWAHGDTTASSRADSQGNPWTLQASAIVQQSIPAGWSAHDLGLAGDPFGSGSYYGMACYPIPAKGDTLYLSRENAGTWTIEKHSKESGAWASRVLDASDTLKLARPMSITGIGPLETIYSAISSYAGYTNYQADYRAV